MVSAGATHRHRSALGYGPYGRQACEAGQRTHFGDPLNCELQRCLTQPPLSWSSTTTPIFEPPLGACCDRSGLTFSCLHPSPTFSSPTRRMVPPVWSWTCDYRGRAVLIFSASSLRQNESSQSSSL